jgi:hypothetical protein
MNFDLSRSDVERLLAGFLAGTQAVALNTQVTDCRELPEPHRAAVQRAHEANRAWTAWSTDCGFLVAWGDYDIAASKRLYSYVLSIGWCGLQGSQHATWCRCDPGRPTEWVIGRGYPE